jgi:hypothetical protein
VHRAHLMRPAEEDQEPVERQAPAAQEAPSAVQGEPSAVARAPGKELVAHRNEAEELVVRLPERPARREELQSAAEGPVRLGEAAVRPVGARNAEV